MPGAPGGPFPPRCRVEEGTEGVKMMTPNDVDVLLHYYTTMEPHERAFAPAVSETIRNFQQRGILEEAECASGLRVTAKGEKLVAILCATPDPINLWTDPGE